MPESTEPIGAPVIRRLEERTYVGPRGWSLPTRARDLALVLHVELTGPVVTVSTSGRLERVTLHARGDVRNVDRFWRRLDEAADAAGGAQGSDWNLVRTAGRWTLRGVLAAIFSSGN